jgi:hypothetical protein
MLTANLCNNKIQGCNQVLYHRDPDHDLGTDRQLAAIETIGGAVRSHIYVYIYVYIYIYI